MKPKGKYAWTATVGEKGQIVIPKQAREIFDINSGDTLVLLGDEKKRHCHTAEKCIQSICLRRF